jgi:acyl-CoA thioesterase
MRVKEVQMAKQTGPGYRVKGAVISALSHGAAVCMLAAALSACASSWHNARKTAQEAATDERLCSQDAEEAALARTARQRVDYGRTQPNPIPGMNRGETPMQMQERTHTEDVFNREFADCMTSKGYKQDKP